MAVCVHGDRERGVTELGLHFLRRKLKAAGLLPIDKPARVEMPKGVHPGILRPAVFGDYARLDLHTMQNALDEIGVIFGAPGTSAKYQAILIAF